MFPVSLLYLEKILQEKLHLVTLRCDADENVLLEGILR